MAFQGERGAFGDEAARAYFGKQAVPVPCRSFVDVFRAVAAGEVEHGLVPVENSQSGSINEVYDLLRQHDLFVIGEISHAVNQCLLCLPGQQLGDIRRVISHPQALAQCDAYLRELKVEVVATYDTAGSAKMVREENLVNVAAIAGAGRGGIVRTGNPGAQYPDHQGQLHALHRPGQRTGAPARGRGQNHARHGDGAPARLPA